ncbi:MAG: NINE protein [Selenomonas sp.]
MEASKSEEKIYYVSSKSRITAILLCCLGFLGLGGFHRLYVKKWAQSFFLWDEPVSTY